ncbi:uncharacterized protein LOC108627941 [Ceratina calcarata]|uniref:Uncharacterized protein LOC108627941 n=1 Tax=Ceratina calcarata TaxID=156304 RepID=A0AAJ7J521_9HYME|nr:uncharacterized protein LOC108627941 [Ceratina calcarata]
MNKVEELMDEFYIVLRHIRYPKITGASSKNIQSTILSGENRISLLSWLLIEKSTPAVATKLQNLRGPTLEAELLKCYSEMGICNDKQLLLGNCSVENQLSFLSLLLNFIESIFIESAELNDEKEIEDVTSACKEVSLSDLNSVTCTIKPKLSYLESVQYFNDSQKYLDEHKELPQNCESETKESIDIAEGVKTKDEETDWNLTFNKERQYFIQDFGSDGLWQMLTNEKRASLPSFDDPIERVSNILSSVDKFFDGKEIISTADIPERLKKLDTDLSEMVGETSTYTEKIRTFYTDTPY